MKKLAILGMTFLFAMAVVNTQAQVKQEIAQVKETKKELKVVFIPKIIQYFNQWSSPIVLVNLN